jgi:hypothetical protein
MKQFQCNIIGISETSTNWNHNKLKQQCQKTLQLAFRNSSMIVSTSSIVHDRPFLPGGTATISLGEWNSKIEKKLFDPSNMEGWTGATYCLSSTRKLHVITGYRVCPNKTTAKNSLSTHTQQVMMMKEKGIIDPDPRKQFFEDLILFIRKMGLSDDDYLLLYMDANTWSDRKI